MFYDPQAVPAPATQEEEPYRAILRKAANLIRRHGLAKNIQHASNGSMCLHGAIFIAATGATQGASLGGNAKLAHIALHDYMVSRKTPGGTTWFNRGDGDSEYLCHYANWNNQPERTAEEVIAALEGAANAA